MANSHPSDTTAASLLKEANRLLAHAHAPYSGFPVAAVAVDEQGRTFGGVNVENASLGLTVCAERVAIFSAIAAGARRITAMAVAAQRLKPISPCGACRQVMTEFCSPDTPVYSDAGNGQSVRWTVAELLPHSFSGRALEIQSSTLAAKQK